MLQGADKGVENGTKQRKKQVKLKIIKNYAFVYIEYTSISSSVSTYISSKFCPPLHCLWSEGIFIIEEFSVQD